MIYFLEALTDPPVVKIGYTGDGLHSRMKAIQSSCPVETRLLGIVPGVIADERRLHRRFRSARIRGEWFRVTPALAKLIASKATVPLVVPNGVSLSIPLSPETYRRLAALAAQQGRPVANLARVLIEEGIERRTVAA